MSQPTTPVMDATDYADMLSYLSDFAESLESEATCGPGNGHPVTTACHKASLLLRRAEAILKPLAEAGPDDDTAIELPKRTDTEGRDVTELPGLWDESDTIDYTPDEARRINSLEMWGPQ